VKLTNWQTFLKNIALLAPTLLIFIYRNRPGRFGTPSLEWALTCMGFIFAVCLSVFCIRHQPLLDFRPYQVGTSIPEEMSIPAGAPADIYETVLVYQKNGFKIYRKCP
jgi:hypothetical protein